MLVLYAHATPKFMPDRPTLLLVPAGPTRDGGALAAGAGAGAPPGVPGRVDAYAAGACSACPPTHGSQPARQPSNSSPPRSSLPPLPALPCRSPARSPARPAGVAPQHAAAAGQASLNSLPPLPCGSIREVSGRYGCMPPPQRAACFPCPLSPRMPRCCNSHRMLSLPTHSPPHHPTH